MIRQFMLTIGFFTLATTVNQAVGIEVLRFQPDGIATAESIGVYREPLDRSRKFPSVTLCGRFYLFYLHSRGTFFKLMDTVLSRESMLKAELWVERVRPVLAHTYNFQILKIQLWAFRWYHLCFTYDHTATLISTYIDGELSNTQVYDIGGPIYGNYASVGQGDSASESFSGDLSQVNIWDKVLSEKDIQRMARCEVDLSGNYISWEKGWDIQDVTTYDLPLSKFCDQDNGPVYFWFPPMDHPTSQYLCEALGTHLPVPSSKQEIDFWINLAISTYPKEKACHFKLWTPLNDLEQDGVWVTYDGSVAEDVYWTSREPNGMIYENCAVLNVNGLEDVDCVTNFRCAVCTFLQQQRFSLLGACERELRNVYFVAYQDDIGQLEFKGYGEYHIINDNGTWTWLNAVQNYIIARMELTEPNYPMGRRWWTLEQEVCDQEPGSRRMLLLSPCRLDQYTCDNAQCVALIKRCDLKYDCQDKSDEYDCQLVDFPENYQAHLPPRPYGQERESLPITFAIKIESISIDTIHMTLDVTYEVEMTWVDSRLQFLNIKRNQSMNPLKREVVEQLWIPMASFVNTGDIHHTEVDVEATMFANRLADPDERDRATPAEVDVFYGRKNSLTIRRKYRTVYMCNFDLILYPFDLQTCEMHLRILSASRELLTFDQMKSNVIFVPSPLLLEYEVGTVTLIYDNSGYFSDARVRIPLSRRYGHAMLNIYIPSFILIIVSFTTLFFRTSEFEVRIMSALTAQLVVATLFSQVASSLPKSSYFKMVDIWLLFCIGITFLVILLHSGIDLYMHDVGESTVTSTPVEAFGLKSSKAKQSTVDRKTRRMVLGSRWVIFLLFAGFNAIYWTYIMI